MTDEQLAREPDITKLSYGQRLRKLLNKEPGEGVRSVRTYGVRLYDHDLFDHQPSDKKTAEKIRDVELARLGAEEEIEKGRGEGGRAKERGEGEGKGKQSILEGEAAGLKAIMEGLKEHPEVAISYFTSQGMAAAGGEGPQGTRPDVVAFGESGPMRTLDLSRDRTKGKTISKPKTTEEK